MENLISPWNPLVKVKRKYEQIEIALILLRLQPIEDTEFDNTIQRLLKG